MRPGLHLSKPSESKSSLRNAGEWTCDAVGGGPQRSRGVCLAFEAADLGLRRPGSHQRPSHQQRMQRPCFLRRNYKSRPVPLLRYPYQAIGAIFFGTPVEEELPRG
jgi:hypothetical protein